MTRYFAVGALVLSILACGTDDPKTDPVAISWNGGEFTLTAHDAVDTCLDGAGRLIAIPGVDNGESREFTNPLAFPGSADNFPFQTQMTLVDPFTPVTVTFAKTGDSTFNWTPEATNKDVDMGVLDATWTGCTANFAFGGEWTAEKTGDGDVRFIGKGHFRVSSTNENDACPVFAKAPPCNVSLDLIATRKK